MECLSVCVRERERDVRVSESLGAVCSPGDGDRRGEVREREAERAD